MADGMNERISLGRVALGARIRSIREGANLPLASASEGAGISYSYLSDVERGRRLPTLEVLDGIASALDTSVCALLAGLYPWDSQQAPPPSDPIPDGRKRLRST